MDYNYIIDGEEIKGEQAIREFARTYSPKGRKAFKQDFRLANGARTKPLSDVLDMLERQGAIIEKI